MADTTVEPVVEEASKWDPYAEDIARGKHMQIPDLRFQLECASKPNVQVSDRQEHSTAGGYHPDCICKCRRYLTLHSTL